MSSERSPLIGSVLGDSGVVANGSNHNYSTCKSHEEHHLTIEGIGLSRKDSHVLHINIDNKTEKSIGTLGSFVLIVNNLTGPGMLGFPNLFQKAGIIPVVTGIIFVYLSASLCGTLLADSIASIPKNHDFDLQIDFSSAFRYTVGEDWYVVAETLFLISCGVQACAGIVETAQSLDGFIASFLFGKTYAIEFYPKLQIINWTPTLCHEETETMDESNLEDCTPFHNAGTLVFTLGFFVTALIFLPLGRGHLKETIFVQFISFIFMIILLFQFSGEFVHRGLDNQLPWVGNELSQVAGVILFNYAFSITLPAWLNEKESKVSVNKVVWTSSTTASIIYMMFGLMGAMAFAQVGPNVLILLTSSKVHFVTRLCAALFGVMIIGCGVPVFCVIIKSALQRNEVCSPSWAMFCGAFLPYLMSWTLYQGTLLMSMLNWTGLVVNGLVAFLLPMLLALKTLELRNRRAKRIEMIVQANPTTIETSLHAVSNGDINGETESLLSGVVTAPTSSSSFREEHSILIKDKDVEESNGFSHSPEISPRHLNGQGNGNSENVTSVNDRDVNVEEGGFRHHLQAKLLSNTTVQPLPYWLEGYRKAIVLFMIISFATIIGLTILTDAIEGITPPEE